MKLSVVLIVLFLIGCSIFRSPDWRANQAKYTISPYPNEEDFENSRVITQYAPILHQYTLHKSPTDFIADFDFDSDGKTNNNRENSTGANLQATLYYSILETSTHYYLTYLSYHVEDGWSEGLCKYLAYWFGGQHENDGENIQLVIEKDSAGKGGDVVIIAFQNHNATDYLLHPKLQAGKSNSTYGAINDQLFNGSHPVFVLEPGKHAIYTKPSDFHFCIADRDYEIIKFSPGSLTSAGDPWTENGADYQYALKPIKANLWDKYTENSAIGDGGLMDGGIDVRLERGLKTVEYSNIPRFFDGDEWSVVLIKKDAGILPFSFAGGQLFFDPAHYYKEKFNLDKAIFNTIQWDTNYLYNPYLPDDYRVSQ